MATSMKLPAEQKKLIEQSARQAAARQQSPNFACPYPFSSREADHWKAAWILAGGTLDLAVKPGQ